eukprot:TRINITY_DN7767_c0_g1_i1.p1 TRINITY_DN7767_c0_g1~~TRINITY_DN7767_c0_g1_i1.p1  ORF type:complete len:281 (-),score=74.06 TRINITY_DN7767_c0_g1_i1:229-1071(-)
MCLSGALRTFHRVQQLINWTMVAPNNADVFVHVAVPATELQQSIELLSSIPWIKAFTVDVQKTFIIDPEKNTSVGLPDYDSWLRACGGERAMHINKHLPMFRKIYLCDQLVRDYEVRHGVRYKWFVRSRPDLVSTFGCQVVDLTTCPPGFICLHQRRILAHQWQFRDGTGPNCDSPFANYTADCPFCCEYCSDFFAVGDRDVMKTYADVVFKFPDWPPVFGTRGGHREVMILWSLQQLGVGDRVRESKDVLKTAQPWLVRDRDDVRRHSDCRRLQDGTST